MDEQPFKETCWVSYELLRRKETSALIFLFGVYVGSVESDRGDAVEKRLYVVQVQQYTELGRIEGISRSFASWKMKNGQVGYTSIVLVWSWVLHWAKVGPVGGQLTNSCYIYKWHFKLGGTLLFGMRGGVSWINS